MCARMALPAAAPQQQVMAVSVLACERVLADLDGPAGWKKPAGPYWHRFRRLPSGPAASHAA
jgi:hypothetical protein